MRSRQFGKESVGCLVTIPKQENRYWRRGLGEERELEPAQFLLLEQGIETEWFTKSGNEVAGAEGVDAVLRAIESMGRDRDQL